MPEHKRYPQAVWDTGDSNLPFDIRLLSYGTIGTEDSRGRGVSDRVVDVRRGYIRTDWRQTDDTRQRIPTRYLYFLYNPSTISTSYQAELDNEAAASRWLNPNQQGQQIGMLQQSLDFSLLFDRTYEVLEGSQEGAWKDVRAALALGMVLMGTSNDAINTAGSDMNMGAMGAVPCYFHFGNQVGGMTFYGALTSMSIEYTHFSKDMIPIRVGMRISAQLMPSNTRPDDVGTSARDSVGSIPDSEWGGPDALNDVDGLMDRLFGSGGSLGPGPRLWDQ